MLSVTWGDMGLQAHHQQGAEWYHWTQISDQVHVKHSLKYEPIYISPSEWDQNFENEKESFAIFQVWSVWT